MARSSRWVRASSASSQVAVEIGDQYAGAAGVGYYFAAESRVEREKEREGGRKHRWPRSLEPRAGLVRRESGLTVARVAPDNALACIAVPLGTGLGPRLRYPATITGALTMGAGGEDAGRAPDVRRNANKGFACTCPPPPSPSPSPVCVSLCWLALPRNDICCLDTAVAFSVLLALARLPVVIRGSFSVALVLLLLVVRDLLELDSLLMWVGCWR